MDKKEISNSSLDRFLIPVYKIYLNATFPTSGFYRILINHMSTSTQEAGLDWMAFSTSHQVGWIECIFNIHD